MNDLNKYNNEKNHLVQGQKGMKQSGRGKKSGQLEAGPSQGPYRIIFIGY